MAGERTQEGVNLKKHLVWLKDLMIACIEE